MRKKHEIWAMIAFFAMIMCIVTGQSMTKKKH